jgi:hemin uptake protein HemP
MRDFELKNRGSERAPADATGERTAGKVQHGHEPAYDTNTLFGSHRQLRILHRGDTYHLRITRQGKLLLNK